MKQQLEMFRTVTASDRGALQFDGLAGVRGADHAMIMDAGTRLALRTAEQHQVLTDLCRKRYRGIRHWAKRRSAADSGGEYRFVCRLCGGHFRGRADTYNGTDTILYRMPVAQTHLREHVDAIMAYFLSGGTGGA